MNALAALVRMPFAKALGWTLIHSLWEGALIAALVAGGFALIRPASARARYALACAGMLAMLAAFAVTLVILWPAPGAPIAIPPPNALRVAPPGGLTFPAPPLAPPDRLTWIVPFWMLGVFAFYLRTAGGWLAAQRLRTRGTFPAPPEWQDCLRALAARLRVTRPVLLLESCLAETPVLIGFLRPAILIPAGLLAGLAPDQLEAILLHELTHIRRHDYAVNVIQSLVEGLLFYHPAVWWLSSLVRAERENCCDDAVVALRGDAISYAATLAALEQRRAAAQPALAATGGNLMKRIRRLLEPQTPRPAAAPVLAAIILLASLAAGLSAWQPQTSPGSSDAQFQLGVTYLSAKNYRAAEDAFRRAYALDPANTRGLFGVVETYMEQGMTDQAIQLLQSESSKVPARADLHQALGDVELRAGQYDQALAEFDTILAATPPGSAAQGQIYLKIGEVNRRKSDFAAAIDAYQQGIKILPDNLAARISLGVCLVDADRWPEGRQAYEAVLKLDPINGVALNNLAFGLAEHHGNLAQALALAQQATRILPAVPEVSDTLGWIYLKGNLPADALPIFQDLVAKQPASATFHFHLGMAFAQAGERAQAAAELKQALSCNPRDAEKAKIEDLLNSL